MSEAMMIGLAIYMIAGIFILVASGALEAFTEGWIDLLSQRWLPVTTLVLHLLAVAQIVLFLAFWPAVIWHELAWRSARSSADGGRVERRRIP